MYYHAAVAGAIVKPGCTKVLPAAPKIISNSEGAKKHDCELKAGKRWLSAHKDEYKWLKPTILGDDLYAHRPFCEQIIEDGMSFIFTYKEESHLWLYEILRNSYMGEVKETKWDTRKKKQVVYQKV